MNTLLRPALCALALIATLLLAAGRASAASAQHARAAHATRITSLRERLVDVARHWVGVRYTYGGSSPRTGFDCSGFVRFVYSHVGISLPHSSYADFGLGRKVYSLRPGDLVFFDGLGHVGIYVGHGKFIHAPHTGTRVRYQTMASYARVYDGARRVLR